MPMIDLHCDTLSRLLANRRAGGTDTLRAGPGGHVFLEKLRDISDGLGEINIFEE